MTRNIPFAKIQAFKEQFRGQLVCRSDKGYDTARRVWNGRLKKWQSCRLQKNLFPIHSSVVSQN
jgi:hypothetical protein